MTKTATRPWLVFGPPVVVALVTFLLSGFVDMLGREDFSPDEMSSMLPVLLVPLPFLVSALWAWGESVLRRR